MRGFNSTTLGLFALFFVTAFGFSGLLSIAEARVNRGGFVCNENSLQDPDSPSCATVACDILGGARACDDSSEQETIAQICLNNFNGNCLRQSCGMLSLFVCQAINQIFQVAASCQGVCDTSCSYVACGYVGCSTAEDVSNVNLACSGHISGGCIEQNCRDGSCATLDGLQTAARLCGGRM